MAIDGRITCDVLFHDTDGTASLKVVSLEDSTAYTTGKVAIVSGTVGTAGVTYSVFDSSISDAYSDASGSGVSFSTLSRVAFAASALTSLRGSGNEQLYSQNNEIACTRLVDGASVTVSVPGAGTASYTLVLYGS